jgi:hypothetical protein
MTTATLLHGVVFGKVADGSLVRAHEWQQWRSLCQVREVCALRREQQRVGNPLTQNWKPPTPTEEASKLTQKFLRCAISPLEALLLALQAGVQVTRAQNGMVHRIKVQDAHHYAFVTSFTHGGQLDPHVGKVIDNFDPSCMAALQGRGVWGSQGKGPAQRAISQRLARHERLRGIAMLPVRVMGHTYAMIELGRADHPFRASDKARLAGVRNALENHFEQKGWDPWHPEPQKDSPKKRPVLLIC